MISVNGTNSCRPRPARLFGNPGLGETSKASAARFVWFGRRRTAVGQPRLLSAGKVCPAAPHIFIVRADHMFRIRPSGWIWPSPFCAPPLRAPIRKKRFFSVLSRFSLWTRFLPVLNGRSKQWRRSSRKALWSRILPVRMRTFWPARIRKPDIISVYRKKNI